MDPTLVYQPLIPPLADAAPVSGAIDVPDRRDGALYRCEPQLQLAVELALATGRPLLLRGDPGSGKSSLAAYVARNLNYRYYETVVTSLTSAQDLLWRFDLVRRLADAQARGAAGGAPLNDFDYIEPGVLWWLYDRASATQRGWAPGGASPAPAAAQEPNAALNATRDGAAAVLLIDEIDKADPDVPNALLVPLGSQEFAVTDLRERAFTVRPQAVAVPRVGLNGQPQSRLLVVITTNEERELPPAFVRRCVSYRLEHPHAERLVEIARLHFDRPPLRPFTAAHEACARDIAQCVQALRKERHEARRRLPGTAEFLDAVRACISLDISVGSSTWTAVEHATLLKDEGLSL